jgi:iron complex outermembrane receptor protein
MDYLQGYGEFVPNSRFNQAGIRAFGGLTTGIGVYRVYYDYVKLQAGMSVLPAIQAISEKGRKNEIWYQDLDMHMVASQNTFYFNAFKLHANLAYQFNHRRLNGDEPEPHFTLVDAKLNTVNYEIKSNITSSHRSNFIIVLQGMYQVNRNQEAPEHVLPDYSLNDIAVSGLVQHDFENLHFQIGLRFDNRVIDVPEQESHAHGHQENGHEEEEEAELLPALNRYYGNLSGSFGLTYDLSEHFLFRTNLASAYRTPSVAELTQDGAHGVRYEQGNRDLYSQRNYEADISIHYHLKQWMFDLAGYYNFITDYIFLAPTADTTDEGQKIYRYLQSNASIYGLEALAELLLLPELSLKGNYTYTRGQQSNGNNLPFIPQNKINLEIKWLREGLWKLHDLYLKAGSGIAFDQIHPAPFETSTGGYTTFNAGLGLSIMTGGGPVQLDIIASNIFNKQYTDHLSTLKELGYQDPGRNVMVSITLPFATRNK